MEIITHVNDDIHIAEISSSELTIKNVEDGLDMMGNMYYNGYDRIIIHEKNIIPTFFDLKNGMAGEILQKFSTYRVRLAIVGDFDKYPGQALRDFIYESNKGRHVNFVSTIQQAIDNLS